MPSSCKLLSCPDVMTSRGILSGSGYVAAGSSIACKYNTLLKVPSVVQNSHIYSEKNGLLMLSQSLRYHCSNSTGTVNVTDMITTAVKIRHFNSMQHLQQESQIQQYLLDVDNILELFHEIYKQRTLHC